MRRALLTGFWVLLGVAAPSRETFASPLASFASDVTTPSAPDDCSYDAGKLDGKAAARQEPAWGWAAASACATCAGVSTCIISPYIAIPCATTGCLGVTTAAYFMADGRPPEGPKCEGDAEYAAGFVRGYQGARGGQNAKYAAGAGCATAAVSVPAFIALIVGLFTVAAGP